MTKQSTPFALFACWLAWSCLSPAAADAYVFYIGFDPNGVKPERPVKKGRKG